MRDMRSTNFEQDAYDGCKANAALVCSASALARYVSGALRVSWRVTPLDILTARAMSCTVPSRSRLLALSSRST
jgi:hypothetical protein